MTHDSLTYNGVDLYKLARLKVIAFDSLFAPLRARKVTIPGRSGAYDYGAKYHDERTLRLSCTITGEITDARFDDLKYTLSRKGRIVLWDKPDRYYFGQCYDAVEVLDYERHCMREFELNFTCDPYAYAPEPTVLRTSREVLPTSYQGTRQVPARITIRNTGTTPMHNIIITARERQ